MKYVTDAHLSGLANELRKRGIDCQTIHKLMRSNEESQVQIKDPEIFSFLLEKKGGLTLITLDTEFAEYCGVGSIPCIRVQDLVAEHIIKTK